MVNTNSLVVKLNPEAPIYHKFWNQNEIFG